MGDRRIPGLPAPQSQAFVVCRVSYSPEFWHRIGKKSGSGIRSSRAAANPAGKEQPCPSPGLPEKDTLRTRF